jgi:hypothetical protein
MILSDRDRQQGNRGISLAVLSWSDIGEDFEDGQPGDVVNRFWS